MWWAAGDQRRTFTVVLGISWLLVVALPILLSMAFGHPWKGLPLAGVIVWFAGLRVARWLSPAARADAATRRGRYAQALALCNRALSITGARAWTGSRRLVWLNRRAAALLALGRPAEALATNLDALDVSADPETVANCASSLLALNRYAEAAGAARLALSLTRERSVLANTVLAQLMLARRLPAEAEALARAGLADVQSLLPLARREHYVECLAALCRAERAQGHDPVEREAVRKLRQAAGRAPVLRAIALVEAAESQPATPDGKARAITLFADAFDLAEHYVLWYVSQPGTLAPLAGEAAFTAARDAGAKYLAKQREHAPDEQAVALALATAQTTGRPRPAPQSSRTALLAQVVTLTATVALLFGWTWAFFIAG